MGRLPPRLQPQSWKTKFKDPVVKMRCNLYGHPLAGLYWELWSSKVYKDAGFEPVPGWECLWYHKQLKLLLSSYVDDMKMAGKVENLAIMWDRLAKKPNIDRPVPAGTNTG